MNVISVYNPPWAIDQVIKFDADEAEYKYIKGPEGNELMVSDLLWCALEQASVDLSLPTIIGGDFNISETFETKWPNPPHGCAYFLNRMKNLGFIETLRFSAGKITPTFKHSRGAFEDQIDHIFVSDSLVNLIESCVAGETARVFGGNTMLSDHVPVILTLRK